MLAQAAGRCTCSPLLEPQRPLGSVPALPSAGLDCARTRLQTTPTLGRLVWGVALLNAGRVALSMRPVLCGIIPAGHTKHPLVRAPSRAPVRVAGPSVDTGLGAMKSALLSARDFPPSVDAIFQDFTGVRSAEWGRRAAVAIIRIRRRTGRTASFNELFEELERGRPHPVDWDALDRVLVYSFRHHAAVHWRRAGWINWTKQPRSLRTGRAFRELRL